ncbi:hypothetical protein DL96DRAFT_1469450, partial [Flagelloscypha sp. PMI_526]
CQIRSKRVENGVTHPYCSRTCAAKGNSGMRLTKGLASPAAPKRKSTCKAPNCTGPTYIDGGGVRSQYCSIAHRDSSLCTKCFINPCEPQTFVCWQCRGPMLLEVPAGSRSFTSVDSQFKAAWRHSSLCPTVKHVYEVASSKQVTARYKAYQASVESRGHFQRSRMESGNEHRRFHGTKRECRLGDPGCTQFCSSTTCSLCSILQDSFEINQFGSKTGWGRFGWGIYSSSTASKANDYSSNGTYSPLRALILANVVVGRGCKMTQGNSLLNAPPAGYDSVRCSLNWDETVMYKNDAILPSYLVMFS